MIPFVVSKLQVEKFVRHLGPLLSVIKQISGKIMLPTVFTESPDNPEQDFLLLLRNFKALQKFTLDKEYIKTCFREPEKLSQLYALRCYSFKASDSESRRLELYNCLKGYYRQSGFMIQGGF